MTKPNEIATIAYVLSRNANENAKVLFSDMRVYDEVNLIIDQISLTETREFFKYARLEPYYLIEYYMDIGSYGLMSLLSGEFRLKRRDAHCVPNQT